MTNEELTEYLFKRGLMPRWAYYQLNGKTAAENYRDQYLREVQRERADREIEEYKTRRKAEIEAELEKEVEEKLAPTVEDALNDLLKDWQ